MTGIRAHNRFSLTGTKARLETGEMEKGNREGKRKREWAGVWKVFHIRLLASNFKILAMELQECALCASDCFAG